MNQQGDLLTIANVTPVEAERPSTGARVLELLNIYNPNASAVYVTVMTGESGSEVAVGGPHAIGETYTGPLFLGFRAGKNARISIRVSTAADGTGDPASSVEVTPVWI